MKNKTLIYLLVPLNLLIWGYFARQIFGISTDDEKNTMHVQPGAETKSTIATDTSHYRLSLDYPDPFLKDYKSPKAKVSTAKKEKANVASSIKPTPTVASTPSTNVRFFGLIKNNNTGIVTALLQVNGQSMMVKVNDVINGYAVKTIARDSILLLKGRERLAVRK